MSDQITPGKWAVEYDGPSNPIVTATSTEGDLRWQIVALVKTSEADARLMAAGPELLRFVARWSDYYSGEERYPELTLRQELAEARNLLARIGGKDGE